MKPSQVRRYVGDSKATVASAVPFVVCPDCHWPANCPRYRSCVQAERRAGIAREKAARSKP